MRRRDLQDQRRKRAKPRSVWPLETVSTQARQDSTQQRHCTRGILTELTPPHLQIHGRRPTSSAGSARAKSPPHIRFGESSRLLVPWSNPICKCSALHCRYCWSNLQAVTPVLPMPRRPTQHREDGWTGKSGPQAALRFRAGTYGPAFGQAWSGSDGPVSEPCPPPVPHCRLPCDQTYPYGLLATLSVIAEARW